MKKMFFLMLLLAGTASMKGQEIPDGPKMVVTGNMVNTGVLTAAIPIDLRTNADGVGRIDNKADGDIKTPALNVSAGTLLNNEADLCVGCGPAKPKLCDGAIIYAAAWDYKDQPGDGAKAGGAANDADASWSPYITTTGNWAAGDILVDEFTATSIDLCVYKSDGIKDNGTSWANAVNKCADGTYADGDATAGWYLPNEKELRSIYIAIGGSGGAWLDYDAEGSLANIVTSADPMFDGYYWSSTESTVKDAMYFGFSTGNTRATGKGLYSRVRCVRRL
jgi:hypothetical protein